VSVPNGSHEDLAIEELPDAVTKLARRLELLADHLGVDLDRLEVEDSPGVRHGAPATYAEFEALARLAEVEQ
jgi:hypothetical protein